ncbi:hypothetical protein ACHAXR_000121 [Thalassiosira sp. AJA248-18]
MVGCIMSTTLIVISRATCKMVGQSSSIKSLAIISPQSCIKCSLSLFFQTALHGW